ncbi:hypothetical protein KHM83_05425 [Fusibacter paucivorans]|uniref:Phosphatidate cytidylyltransferase n=1 Tax=Fusibacter paucivorans TaxID=76009 RepID=A0ABS5PMI4_9FIRM|nr:hypothetical protein [Fusibacter paucivorans]MBS7526107.1 hypothetical protein [Fusibacter paucivorans]
MKNYRLTKRGKLTAGILGILAVAAIAGGGVYTAGYVFVFCLAALGLSIYEFFFNR